MKKKKKRRGEKETKGDTEVLRTEARREKNRIRHNEGQGIKKGGGREE